MPYACKTKRKETHVMIREQPWNAREDRQKETKKKEIELPKSQSS